MLFLSLEQIIFYPFLLHYLQKKSLKNEKELFALSSQFHFKTHWIRTRKFSYGKKNEIIYKLKSTPSFCKNTMLLQTIHPWEKSMTEIFVSLLFG